MPDIDIRKPHLRRLRAVWQSAGWRCHDVLELQDFGVRMPSKCKVLPRALAAGFLVAAAGAWAGEKIRIVSD